MSDDDSSSNVPAIERTKQKKDDDKEQRPKDDRPSKESRSKEESNNSKERGSSDRKRSHNDSRHHRDTKSSSRSPVRKSTKKTEDRRERSSSEDTEDVRPVSSVVVSSTNRNGTGSDLMTRTGGAYIPPHKLALMQAQITDKASAAYQRISWEALKKSIHGLVNKANANNIGNIVREMFRENLIRGRGMLTRSLLTAQGASPTFTHVFAALVAIINTKFPAIGELILKRLITEFKRAFKRNQKEKCLSTTRFVAHLVNQQVAHEIIALELLALLLEQPTDDSVEVAVGFLKEAGSKLTLLSPRGMIGLFDRLRNILTEAAIDKRVQYMIEVMFQIRRDGFKDYPAIKPELDLVEENDQFTHMMTLEDDYDTEELCNVFRFDPDFLVNEEKYKAVKDEILGEDEDNDEEGSNEESSSEEEDKETAAANNQTIIDNTETNLIKLRRTIYLVIQSSLDFEEAAHKLMRLEIKPGQEYELCNMIMDCCAQLRTYEKFFGLLAQRFCQLKRAYVEEYEKIFAEQFNTIHRLELVKLRNVARFFSHLLHTDAVSWGVLQAIRLNEDDTTSSSRIFIKILFQELSEYMGLTKLNDRLRDPTLQVFFGGLLPRDNPKDTRFAINYFTSIGLGGLTVDLREHLKQEQVNHQEKMRKSGANDDGTGSESESSSSSSGSSSSDDSSSSEEDERDSRSKHKKTTRSPHKSKGVSSRSMDRRHKDRDENYSRSRKDTKVSSSRSKHSDDDKRSRRSTDRQPNKENRHSSSDDRKHSGERSRHRYSNKERDHDRLEVRNSDSSRTSQRRKRQDSVDSAVSSDASSEPSVDRRMNSSVTMVSKSRTISHSRSRSRDERREHSTRDKRQRSRDR